MPELVDVTPGSPEWLAARREGITATDLPAILGISPYECAYSLYYRKTGAIPDHPPSDRWELGKYLEPYIAQRWCNANRQTVVPGRLWRSSERPWQMATIDSKTSDAGEPVELKSWADMDRDRWDNGPPATVRAQVLWQMDVMGVARGHVAVLFLPSGELRSYVIEHDESPVIEYPHDVPGTLWGQCRACVDIGLMRERGRDFMDRIDLGDAPDADGSAASLAAARARFTPVPRKVAIIDPTLWGTYVTHLSIRDTHQEAVRFQQVRIREQAGDCGDLVVDGQLVARFDKRGALRRIKAREGDNE